MNQNSYVSNDVSLAGGNIYRGVQWLCMMVILFTLGACVRNEDALDDGINLAGPPVDTSPPSGGDAPPPGGGAPPPGGGEPPPSDDMPPPVDDDPPMDPPPMTDVMVFETTLYPLLRDPGNFCVGCHGATQIPAFAVDNVMDAYNALISQDKVNLVNPELSRIYLRPAEDRHNCGGVTTCDRIAADFLSGIQAWAQQSEPPGEPMQGVVSAYTNFAEAIEGGAARADANVIAMFKFDEGAGNVAMDSSGSGITLQLEGTEWVDGGGLRNVSGKAQASLADSRKLFEMIAPDAEYSVEAWVIPLNTAQDGPARIVSYSIDTAQRNFTLGQNAIYYQLRNRSAGTAINGTPALEALDPQTDTTLQHVVASFDEASGRKVYINGQLAIEENAPDTLEWADDQILVLGNEVTNDRLWQGVLKLVAVHNKVLTGAEVQQNFDAGAGNLVTLRFDLTDLVGAQAHIDMAASQLDAASYLFAEPVYVSAASGVRIKNIRVAVNDSIPVAAQSFRRVDTTVMQSGELISPLGAVIPVALGSEMDQFHLEFEMIGNLTGQAEPIAPPLPPPAVPDELEPELGVRSFSRINDTMSVLTKIDTNSTAVRDRYSELRDSLPATSDILSFAAAHQIAIQRLATTYCGEIVVDAGRCDGFFGNCQIDGNAKGQVADILYDEFIGANIATQPDRAGVTTAVVGMIDDLGCANGCAGGEARTVLNAACAAVLSSAAVTIN